MHTFENGQSNVLRYDNLQEVSKFLANVQLENARLREATNEEEKFYIYNFTTKHNKLWTMMKLGIFGHAIVVVS